MKTWEMVVVLVVTVPYLLVILTFARMAEKAREQARDDHAESLRAFKEMVQAMEAVSQGHRAEREHFVQHIVSMRRAGYTPVEDEPLESWALTDAHEAEVSRARRQEAEGPLIDLGDPRTL